MNKRASTSRHIVLFATAVVSCYLMAYAVYAMLHRVPDEQLSPNFQKLHRGAVWFRWDTAVGATAWYVFYPASAATYWLLNIDSQWHRGDSFGHWFCNEDYIDLPSDFRP